MSGYTVGTKHPTTGNDLAATVHAELRGILVSGSSDRIYSYAGKGSA